VKHALAALESVVTVILVVTGIAGIAYHGFRDGGWVTRGLGAVVDAYADRPLIALGLTIAMFFSYRIWRDRKTRGAEGKYVDFLVFLLMAAGIYFIARFVVKGEV
jgi:hypothetical protein